MNLLERFPKYSPSSDLDQYMMAEVTGMRVNKEERMMEVEISSSVIIPKKILYRIESEIYEAYRLNHFRIHPKYSSELFTIDYVEDLIFESYRLGMVARGFFEDYTIVTEEDGTIVIKVPFIQGGIELLHGAKTAELLSKMIADEFKLTINIRIEQREDYKRNAEAFENDKLDILKHALEQSKQENS